MSETVFERVEKKYLLSRGQYEQFLKRADLIQLDQYGLYTISNLYYDTRNDDCIRWSIEKPIYKEKLRIRTYQADKDDPEVFIELKKKVNGVVYKRRILSTYQRALALCRQKPTEDSSQIAREIEYFCQYYHPEPKVYLAYDRMAYFGLKEDLRITFDQNIRFRTESLSLKPNEKDRLAFKEDLILMEIKVPATFPLWLSRLLSELRIYPVSYSKYGNIYKDYLKDRNSEEDILCLTACSAMQLPG